MSRLPYARVKIWSFSLLESWLKQGIVFIFIGILLAVITPITPSLIFAYIALILFIDLLMKAPQWKLFQAPFFVKISLFVFVLVVNGISVMLHSEIIALSLLGLLGIVNIRLIKTLFQQINWDKVIEVSDFHLWNMWLIAKVSETKFERQRKYSFFQHLACRKKPFPYSENSIYHRLWQLYLGRSLNLIFQLIGVLFVLLVVLLFLNELAFYIGLAVSIHVYTTVIANFFSDQFKSDIVQVLPWNLSSYKRTYLKWTLYGSIILVIPIGIFFGIMLLFSFPFNYYFIYIYNVKIDKSIALLGNKDVSFPLFE